MNRGTIAGSKNDTYRLYKANTFDTINNDIICLIKFHIFINSHSYLNFSHYSNPQMETFYPKIQSSFFLN